MRVPSSNRHGRADQRGAALMIMIVIMVVGVASILVGALSSSALQNARQEKTSAALAQAKDALIGYAITYGDTNTGKAHGYLPCPDTNNDGSANTNQSSTQCAVKNIPVVGRLPWKSLGLPPLRDAHGECLWYAVSGTFKAVAGGYMNDVMNWDTLGQFTIQDANGTTLAGADAHDRPVAVIFSAGPPLGAQNHPFASGQECSGDTSNGVTAYLESGNAFSPPTSPPAAPVALTTGNQNSAVNNDAFLWITPRDIFDHIKKRNDFGTFVSTLLINAQTCLSSLPNPVTINFDTMAETTVTIPVGSLLTGRIPSSCTNNYVNQWRDNLLYAACASGTACLAVNNGAMPNCRGVVVFSGEQNTSQLRTNNTDKNTWSYYLEDTPSTILTSFTTGTITFSGASSYSAALPSTDILACVP